MVDFLIGFAFVAMIVLPAIIGYLQHTKSNGGDL
jgi:Sec-independent protein secretion pathway component TatC